MYTVVHVNVMKNKLVSKYSIGASFLLYARPDYDD